MLPVGGKVLTAGIKVPVEGIVVDYKFRQSYRRDYFLKRTGISFLNNKVLQFTVTASVPLGLGIKKTNFPDVIIMDALPGHWSPVMNHIQV